MEKVTGYLIDVDKETAGAVTIDNTLEAMYRVMNCKWVEIAYRRIGSKKRFFDIYCDEEGLLKDDPKISAIDPLGNGMLVGNLLILNHDAAGNTISLTQDEIDYVRKFVVKQGTRKYPKGYWMLSQCKY